MVTLEEFADIVHRDLVIRRYAGQRNRYICSLEHCEVKDGPILSGVYGEGRSPKEAMNSYAEQISGRLMVFNAYRDTRQEFGVPQLELLP